MVVSAPDSCCSSGTKAAGPAPANGAIRASCASWCLQQEHSGLHLFPSHSPVVLPAPQGSPGVSLVHGVSHSLADKELKELQTLLSQSFPGSESKDGKCNFEKEIILRQKMHMAFKNNKVQLFKIGFFFSCAYATRTSENYFFFSFSPGLFNPGMKTISILSCLASV